MSKTKQDYEVLMTDEGFWFGRLLKNGTMSADSKPIDKDELTNAFAAMFERHCDQNETSEQWIGIEGGGAILVKRFTVDDIQQAATKANKKADRKKKK